MNFEILFAVMLVIFILSMIGIGVAYIQIMNRLDAMEDMWNIIYKIVINPYIKRKSDK